MMKSKARDQNKILKIITTPIRALGKARDFYVKSMKSYAGKIGHGNDVMMMGRMPSANHGSTLPKSFSVNATKSSKEASDDDLRELIRAASANSLAMAGKFDEMLLQQVMMKQQKNNQLPSRSSLPGVGPKGMTGRSFSVGMGKIDEEKPWAFEEEDEEKENADAEMGNASKTKKHEVTYPRSKSHAVNKKKYVL